MASATYKIRNWKEYNQALMNRGNLTIRVDEETISHWTNYGKTGRKGRSNTYSDSAIECALTIRGLVRFPLRQTQGFSTGIIYHALTRTLCAVLFDTVASSRGTKRGNS